MIIFCTDYRAADAISRLEKRLGIPMVTSNQASLLVALRRLGNEPGSLPLGQRLATG